MTGRARQYAWLIFWTAVLWVPIEIGLTAAVGYLQQLFTPAGGIGGITP